MKYGRLRMTTVVALLVCALVPAGASADQKSEALAIAHASGLKKLRDVTEKDLSKAMRRSHGGPNATLATHSLGSATGTFAPPPGISAGAAASISGALAVLGTMPVDRPERQPRFLVWLPQHEAADSDEARRLVTEIIAEAVARAVPGTSVKLGKRDQHPRTVIEIEGRGTLASWVFDNAPRVLDMPTGQSYVWGGFNNQGVGTLEGYPLTDASLTMQERIEFFQLISAHLPSWICIYLPPDDRLAPYPQILRKGQILLFVEPGLYAQVSAKSPEEEHHQKEAK